MFAVIVMFDLEECYLFGVGDCKNETDPFGYGFSGNGFGDGEGCGDGCGAGYGCGFEFDEVGNGKGASFNAKY